MILATGAPSTLASPGQLVSLPSLSTTTLLAPVINVGLSGPLGSPGRSPTAAVDSDDDVAGAGEQLRPLGPVGIAGASPVAAAAATTAAEDDGADGDWGRRRLGLSVGEVRRRV